VPTLKLARNEVEKSLPQAEFPYIWRKTTTCSRPKDLTATLNYSKRRFQAVPTKANSVQMGR